MLMTYQEAREKMGGRYSLNRAVQSGKVYRIARNLYSTKEGDGVLELLSKRYPDAIVTGATALYLHGLIDMPPELVDVATRRGGTKLSAPWVSQSFIPQEWLQVGVSTVTHDGTKVRAYDLERMLLELMRSRNKLPYDIVREAVNSYRKIANQLDIYKLEDYADRIPRGRSYLDRILEEVF